MANSINTTVGTLSDVDIKLLSSQGKLIIENYNEKNVIQACYELRASNIYYDLSNPKNPLKNDLKDGEYILIKPKQLVVIITLETLELENDILGRILTKGKLFSVGLLPVNTYADPGFYGRLGIVFYNLSNNFLKINTGETIAKIEFTRLQEPVSSSYRGQHGYQTSIWPIPTDMIVSYEEAQKDARVKSPPEEIESAFGADVGRVIKRVFKYERYVILAALLYIALSLLIIHSMQGSNWISPM